jgi:hypothetical protein
MPACQTRRGRPKGSGLDDRDLLRRVARMLESDPDLKPTTAIKAIGISDPSTIRRLRDKLRGTAQGEDDTIINSGKFERRDSGEAHRLGEAMSASRRFVRTLSTRSEAAPATAEAAEHESAAIAPREGPHDAVVSWLAAWCGLGLHAISTTVEAQMVVFESFLNVPQIASAIRHQTLLSEHVMAFYSHSTDVRTTLH